MERRTLGRTGFSVTPLSYGAMELRRMDEDAAGRILHAVLDQGINYIDTSPDYGRSEDLIGRAIARRRDEFTLATKCGCNCDADGKPLDPRHIWSRAQLVKNVEDSLRRLRTDRLDVWQLHAALPGDLSGGAAEEVLRAMQDLQAQGKVLTLGCTMKNGSRDEEGFPVGYGLKAMPYFLPWDDLQVMQVVYGALARGCEDLIADAAGRGFGVVARGSFRDFWGNQAELFAASGLDDLRGAEDQGSFMIRFALSHPGIATVLVGTKDPAHLAANAAAAARGPLAGDVYEEAKRRLDAAGVRVGLPAPEPTAG